LAVASLTAAAVATWVAWHDGGSLAGSWRLLVLLVVLWGTSLAVCWCTLTEITTTAEVPRPGELRLIQADLFNTVRTDVKVATTLRIAVVEDRDDEDLPYYRGVLIAEDHDPVAVSEGYCRHKVENDVRRLQQAFEV
jgi:hypothetical protein